MRADRYSRKPVIMDNNKNMVVGCLLSKSLIGVQPGQTLRQLIVKKRAKVALPYYTGPDKPITKSVTGFEASKSHMGFVCASEEQAELLNNYARKVYTEIKNEKRAEAGRPAKEITKSMVGLIP